MHVMHRHREFTDDHLVLGKVANFPIKTQYEPQHAGVYSTAANVHAGQNKLLMSEIQFMLNVHLQRARAYPDVPVDSPFLCVYAGACPCHHLGQLMQMFPNVVFVVVDPAFTGAGQSSSIAEWDTERVVVWAQHFGTHTIDILTSWMGARAFKCGTAQLQSIPSTYFPYFEDLDQLSLAGFDSREDVLFISDVRVDARDEASITSDMDMQALWFHQMQATSGLLKFRLPYVTAEWLADSRHHHFKRMYLEGAIQMPMWGPRSTTECRLQVERGCDVASYDPVLHERQLAGFNRYDRQASYCYQGHPFDSFDAAATAVLASRFRAHTRMVADQAQRRAVSPAM